MHTVHSAYWSNGVLPQKKHFAAFNTWQSEFLCSALNHNEKLIRADQNKRHYFCCSGQYITIEETQCLQLRVSQIPPQQRIPLGLNCCLYNPTSPSHMPRSGRPQSHLLPTCKAPSGRTQLPAAARSTAQHSGFCTIRTAAVGSLSNPQIHLSRTTTIWSI